MRVLMVTSSYPKFPGDVTAPFMESIAQGVRSRGHSVDVVLPHHPQLRRGKDEGIEFFPYHYAPLESWSLWGFAQSLESDIKVRKKIYLLAPLVALALRRLVSERLAATAYDVVHAHWVVPNAALIVDIVRAHQRPLVVSLHGSDVYLAERLTPIRGLARLALRAAGSLTACSDDLRRRAIALGASHERIHTVPYGVDLKAFAPEAPSCHVRERWGVSKDGLLVLGLGRLVEKKGFRYLIEAAARLEGLHVAVAGEGDLREELQALARKLGARLTLPGNLDRATMASALAEADIVVIPSVVDRAGNVDGLPNALLEALASGRPVVGTSVGGIPDLIEDDANGLLVPQRDVPALAGAIQRLAREPKTRLRLGREARRRAEGYLSWERSLNLIEECYAQASALEAH